VSAMELASPQPPNCATCARMTSAAGAGADCVERPKCAVAESRRERRLSPQSLRAGPASVGHAAGALAGLDSAASRDRGAAGGSVAGRRGDHTSRNTTTSMKLQYIAPLLAAGAAAVAIAAAPTAFATARELSACPAMFRSRHPPGCSALPRGRARSDGAGLRAGPRPGDVNGRTSVP
jgi:hypothetical protein